MLTLLAQRMEEERVLHSELEKLRIARQNRETLAAAMPPLRITPRTPPSARPAEENEPCVLQ